jgi:hypothetical protein
MELLAQLIQVAQVAQAAAQVAQVEQLLAATAVQVLSFFASQLLLEQSQLALV